MLEDIIQLKEAIYSACINIDTLEELQASYTEEEIKELKLLSSRLVEFVKLVDTLNK